jgi:hypothetical protein
MLLCCASRGTSDLPGSSQHSGEKLSREKVTFQQKVSLSLSPGFLSFLGEKFSLFSSTLEAGKILIFEPCDPTSHLGF